MSRFLPRLPKWAAKIVGSNPRNDDSAALLHVEDNPSERFLWVCGGADVLNDQHIEVVTNATGHSNEIPVATESPNRRALEAGAGVNVTDLSNEIANAEEPTNGSALEAGADGLSEESSSTVSSDDEGGGAAKAAVPKGAYDPDEYKNMKVPPDIEELFAYITRYKPRSIEPATVLKLFIPEFIPSIGEEVDAFLKMPRPDGQLGGLGTVHLDEPCLNPSDPSTLDFQLRSLSNHLE